MLNHKNLLLCSLSILALRVSEVGSDFFDGHHAAFEWHSFCDKKFTVSLSSTQRLGCLANNRKSSCSLLSGIINQYSLCVREREAERGLGVRVLE